MPSYEYECSACRHTFEVFQKMSDPAEAPCPHCNSPNTKRLISQTSFALKGGGWYKDGYAGPKKKDAKAETSIPTPATAATPASSTPAPSPAPKPEGKSTATKPAGN